MNDEVKPVKHGFLEDSSGDLSSGRLMKLTSFFFAIFFAAVGAAIIFFAAEYAPAEIGNYFLGVIGMFLGVATSAEIVQKLKGL